MPGVRETETLKSFRGAIPSWLASVVAHLLLFLLFANVLKSCGNGSLGPVSHGEFRDVGIYVVDRSTDAENDPSPDEPTVDEPSAEETLKQPHPADEPSVEQPPLIGPRSDASSAPETAGKNSPPKQENQRAARRLGPGETEFFKIRDGGKRFVYVLDASASMLTEQRPAPIDIARAELKASLRDLNPRQEFQVIFYNDRAMSMPDPRGGSTGLLRCSDMNLARAHQFIDAVYPDVGTEHMQALELAISLEADVIFFLTDAGVPILYAGDLDEIRRLNKRRARIHCVEFGEGRNTSRENFLMKLARQNGGLYRYRDVTE